jgi:hypothetical protein
MKTIAIEKHDTVQRMGRTRLIEALYGFLLLNDFRDEREDMILPLGDGVIVRGYYEDEAYRMMFRMTMTYWRNQEVNNYVITLGSLTDHDLRTIVDYLNLRLDARGC